MAGGIRAQASCRRLLLRSPGRGLWGRRRAGGSPAVALSTGCRTSKIETQPEVLSRPRGPKFVLVPAAAAVSGAAPARALPEGGNGAASRASSPQTQCLKLRAARKRRVWVRPEPQKKKWKWSWEATEGPT